MTPSKEFVVGKHNIGYIGSDFHSRMGDEPFELKPSPTFQKLPRSMNDAEIESELKPGLCELGDILAFMDTAPEECKDGNWNLFYTPSFVVLVHWFGFNGDWGVDAWRRVGHQWYASDRVFSPATLNSETKTSALESSDTLTLEKAIKIVKKAGYRIFKEI